MLKIIIINIIIIIVIVIVIIIIVSLPDTWLLRGDVYATGERTRTLDTLDFTADEGASSSLLSLLLFPTLPFLLFFSVDQSGRSVRSLEMRG